ncbi:MAG: hypothetical protein R6X02_31210 [Enhygromyxa sp.]
MFRLSRTLVASSVVVTCAAGSIACSGGSSDDTGASSSTIGITSLGTGNDDTTGDGDGDDDATTTGPLLDVMDPSGDGDGDPNECAAVSETAQNELLPVDIIFAVDTSGSMSDEKNFVQQNMNIFSQQIFLANIDHHVVMIAAASPDGPCINVPLGSGQCPDDSKPPEYVHVFESVGSSNALSKILTTQPQWESSIRPGSIKHLVVVSDDDSSMGALAFDEAFKAIDPDYEDYVFHAIVAYEAPDPLECGFLGATCCSGLIPLAADVGEVYLQLAQLTGGVTGDLCEQQFGPVFDQIAQSVLGSTPLACEWDIPDPPEGESFDPTKVNVELHLDGSDESVYFVENEAACAGGDGWYYHPDNDNPETIRICPATCAKVQAANEASVDILFGCATIPVG